MTISVLGTGAVGSLIGGLLSLSGQDVHLIPGAGRTDPTAPAHGLRIVGPDGWRIAKDVRYGAVRDPDLLVVALRRNHLRALRKDSFRRFVDPRHGLVVFCHADPAEPQRLGFPPSSSSFLLPLMEAVKLQSGEVELLTAKPVFIMEKGSPADGLSKDLSAFGIACRPVEDVVPSLNSFFVYQLVFLAAALCNTTLSHFLSFAEGRELARHLLAEGLLAMQASGRETAALPLMDPRALLERLQKDPQGFEARRFLPDRSYSPALCAFLSGIPSEARELNKRAVEIASSAGLELPWNWKLFQKAGRALGVGFYRDPAELLLSLE